MAAAGHALDWTRDHRRPLLWSSILLLLLLGGGGSGWYLHVQAQAKAAQTLHRGVEALRRRYMQAPDAAPGQEAAVASLAEARRDLRQAKAHLQAAIAQGGEIGVWALWARGAAALSEGRFAAAVRDYTRALDAVQGEAVREARSLLGRAAAQAALGKLPQARADYERVLGLSAGQWVQEARFQLALLQARDAPDKARQALEKLQKSLQSKDTPLPAPLAKRVQAQLDLLGQE